MNKEFGLVSENNGSTVVAQYEGLKRKDTSYQSEAQLEQEFIDTLKEEGYEYLTFNSEEELIDNLKHKLEELNHYTFEDDEWNDFFIKEIANQNYGIKEKTFTIQKDEIKVLKHKDGTTTNIRLLDKDNIHNNKLQVINQYNNSGNRDNRYDVTILVNGIPLVHIELKRRGKTLREAFNQIDRYQRESFWANSGLYQYVQVFIISNGTYTKYYSNTTRDLHLKNKTQNIKSSNTFEFTSYWADQKNNTIIDLIDFAKTFCSKHTLLNILTKYCVFTSNEELMVMRPYQIVATEKILNKVEIAHNYKWYGTIQSGGYIWHTTGSGKTLTSFKTAQLATSLEYIDKVLFVVDRKDLDYQTMKEYDNFQKDAANSNTSTKILERQLNDPNARIIITTIQKLTSFVKRNDTHDIYNKEVVFIFDECHRSQFGDMHKLIVKKFNKYYLFGFTGTPIFKENARSQGGLIQTTDQTFGEKLHTYTIVDAIKDKNVLPFKYDYVGRVDVREDMKDEKVYAIDEEKAFDNDFRIKLVTAYIINNFDKKTKAGNYLFKAIDNVDELAKNNKKKEVKVVRSLSGFNSIFAVANINMAKKYYQAFKDQPNDLKIALIYSFGVNDAIDDGLFDENSESTENLSKSDRDFLDAAIDDYNKMFGTSYDTSSEKFQNYYKDVSLRMKNKEIDMLIVANMFLTGFDAKTLNTLWVDKNLKYHGLIQSFSRTNRILNSIKVVGNIVSFRNLEQRLNDALGLFGDKDACGIVLLKSYEDYYNGYTDDKGKYVRGYKSYIEELLAKFPAGIEIIGEQNKKDFIKLYSAILKVTNILTSFDEFEGNELLAPRDIQDYHSMYQDIHDEFTQRAKVEAVDITEDLEFEMELIKTLDINIDYILNLVKQYHESNMQDKELLLKIQKAITASPELRNKKDLIEQFIESLNQDSDVYKDFETFMNTKKKEELDKIIEEENLKSEETYAFIKKSFDRGNIEENGTDVVNILPQMSRFTVDNDRAKKKQRVLDKLVEFFEKFFSITSK